MEVPVAIQENTELPKGYTIHSCTGSEALKKPNFVSDLSKTWALSYKASTEPAQSLDPKYSQENDAARISEINDALSRQSSEVVYITHKDSQGSDNIAGFFWGASVADLAEHDPEKAAQVQQFTSSSPESTAYLAMMGVVKETAGEKHTGKGLGKILTQELCERFKNKGYSEAIARTINPLALERVYKPLGFNVKNSFLDTKAGVTRYIFSKNL